MRRRAFIKLIGAAAAMGIPLKAGRDISAQDTPTTDPVMLVNETMARTLWPGQDPLGKFVLGPCAQERRVVGVPRRVGEEVADLLARFPVPREIRQRPEHLEFLPLELRSSADPNAYGNAIAEYEQFYGLGVDGVFSDNPDTAIEARSG